MNDFKLGVAYNVFDGEELIEESISRIRNTASYICVVYQEVSNFGQSNDPSVLNIYKNLLRSKLINDVFIYTPNIGNGHSNELTKRNIGLDACRKNGCNVYSSMDSDEYYIPEEYKNAFDLFVKSSNDSSVCKMLTYYKTKEFILQPPEEYYVSLFYKHIPNRGYEFCCPFPFLVDPTRRMRTEKCLEFSRDQIQMHHLSYVRNDIRKKFENSSARINFGQKNIDFMVDYYNNWDSTKPAKMMGMTISDYQTKKVNYLT